MAPTLRSMLIGLIANPLSSKDIRRLTGLARVVDIEEKANLLARLLVGLGTRPGTVVGALDDPAGLVRRAVALARSKAPAVEYLPMEAAGNEEDTRCAAGILAERGASALITLGGDGTIRAAVEGWPEAPLVPLAAGTNNAAALAEEPTVTGVAVVVALESGDPDLFRPTSALRVATPTRAFTAVIDVVTVRGKWLGAGALWEPDDLVEAVVTSARPASVGVASIGARLGPLAPGRARWVRFGPGRRVRGVLGPGLVVDMTVAEHLDLEQGDHIDLDLAGRVVALDGERRVVTETARVRVVTGPRVLDPDRALAVKGIPALSHRHFAK